MFSPAHLAEPTRDRRLLLAALALVIGLAWLTLLAWAASPYGRFLHHADAGVALPIEAALFSLGWLLMIVAMMLPTTIPLVATFAAITGRRPYASALLALLIAGYLVMWSGFGVVAYLGDRLVHAAVDASPWLQTHSYLIAAVTFAIAGAWQFSPLKYRCLDECRSPLGFVMNRWTGNRPANEAFRLGLAHGAFCIGCCWSLMLVMFGVGLGSLGWMLGLGAITAIEKNARWGRRISTPLGLALIFAALLTLTP